MAATYSSFMTTRYYSPVFNTALFDGPLRIYFSQSYESAALKIYHLLQSQYPNQWAALKQSAAQSKEHIFLMMYPEKKDLEMIFSEKAKPVHSQNWEEGLAIGFCQPQDDLDLTHQLTTIHQLMQNWIEKNNNHEMSV
jgi:hypothetical protein